MGNLNPLSLPPPKKARKIIQKRVYNRHKKDPLPSLTKDVVGNVDESKYLFGKDKISRNIRGMFLRRFIWQRSLVKQKQKVGASSRYSIELVFDQLIL
jgi:hypothetical protein